MPRPPPRTPIVRTCSHEACYQNASTFGRIINVVTNGVGVVDAMVQYCSVDVELAEGYPNCGIGSGCLWALVRVKLMHLTLRLF